MADVAHMLPRLDLEKIDEALKEVKDTDIGAIGNTFARRMIDIHVLLLGPVVTYAIGVASPRPGDKEWNGLFDEAIPHGVATVEPRPGEKEDAAWHRAKMVALRNVLDETVRQGCEMAVDRLKPADLRDAAVAVGALLERHTFSAVLHRSLYVSALVLAWGVLEVLSADVWQAVVNLRSATIGLGLLGTKHVPADLLRRYGLNLQNRVGTVLTTCDHYSFKKVDSISAAYAALSRDLRTYTTEPKRVVDLKKTFDSAANPGLRELERVRHLIVHRAGIVDDEYRKSGGSTLPEGSPLPIDSPTVNTLINAAISCGCDLLLFGDTFLAANPEGATGAY